MGIARLKDGRRLHIAPADPVDAAEILQFLNVAAGESDYLSSVPGDFGATVAQETAFLLEQAARPDAGHFIGKVGGRVVALAALGTPTLRRINHTSELSLIVGRAFWNLGAGGAMMAELLEFARACGTLRLVYLSVRQGNTYAIRLYQRFGFVQCGRYSGYFKVGQRYYDALLMELALDGGVPHADTPG